MTLIIFDEMMSELKRRRLLRKGQLIVADKGFYSASNYLIRDKQIQK